MDQKRATSRLSCCCLMLSAVLFLGIIQWSFLPLLVQNGTASAGTVLEVSAGHTSKFAAPFKYLFGDSLEPGLVQSELSVPPIPRTFIRLSEKPSSNRDDFSFTNRQLRAPPYV